MRALEVSGADRDRLYDRFIDLHNQYAVYQERTDRQIPVIALHLAH